MGLSELAGIGVVLAVLLLVVVLVLQLVPDRLERGNRMTVELVAAGLLVGVVLIIAQLTGLLA
jgi:hypothetical protein